MKLAKECVMKLKTEGNKYEAQSQHKIRTLLRCNTLYLTLFIFAATFFLPQFCTAATYYVDPTNGNDASNGSNTNPWRTIDKAKSSVVAGDTVNLLPGNYGSVTFTSSDRRGTSSNYITYQNNPSSTSYSAKFSRIFFSGNTNFYITIRGFDIENRGTGDACVKTEYASHVKIIDCKTHGLAGGTGPSYANIFARASDHILIEDCEVYYSGDWAFAIQLESSDTITVRGCHVHDIIGSGIRTGGGENYIIENNIVHDQRAEWNPDVHGSGISIHSHNTTISGNIIYNFGNTRPIRFYQDYAGAGGYRNMLVENNLVYKTPDFTGIQWWTEFIDVGPNCVFRNNTFIDDVTITFASNADGSGLAIYNNVVTGRFQLEEHNNWSRVGEGGNIYGSLAASGCGWMCFYDEFSPTSNSIVGANFNIGVFFESGATHYPYSANYPYQLKAGSPAIDFGNPNQDPTTDLLGNSRVGLPDAGCYEYGSGQNNLPPIADAGPDQTLTDNDGDGYHQLFLDGSGSTDVDGQIVKYIWTENEKEIGYGYNPFVTLATGEHIITLTVTDDGGLEDSESVTIIINSVDITPPSIVSIIALENSVEIVFDEPLDSISAQDTNNYSIDNGLLISQASLGINGKKVTLATSQHTEEETYILTCQNISDLAGNKMSQTEKTYIYESNLVAYWQFNEGTGLITEDLSGKENTGTLINAPVWHESGAIAFDGINDYINCGNDSSLNLTGSLTISACINPKSFGQNGWGRIVDKSNGSNGYSFFIEEATGTIAYVIYGGMLVKSEPNVIQLNKWQHVGVVYDKIAAAVTFYVDGRQAGTAAYSTPPLDSSASPLIIGIRGYDLNRAFDGLVDNVRIYNRPLSPQQISSLYDNDRPFAFYHIGDKQVNEGANLNFSVTPQDATIVVVINDHNLPSEPNFGDNIFNWTATYDDAGSYEATFAAVQGEIEDIETISITVLNVNRKPAIEPIEDQVVKANTTLTFTVNATDADGDNLSLTATNLPIGAAFTEDTFVWIPTIGQAGFYQVTFTADDGQSQVSCTVNITVDNVSLLETIIDNADIDNTSYTGTWSISGGSFPYDENSFWSRDGATFTWIFNPTVSGYYDISMWWTQWSSRDTNVPVDIEHRDGTARVYVNQQLNAGKWNSLRTYPFVAGQNYKITVTAQPGPSSTCADAVKFALVPETAQIIIDGTDNFSYSDDTFRNTNQPDYASSGIIEPDILKVCLGGLDKAKIYGMSGGWGQSFNLTSDGKVTLSFNCQLTQTPDYENDEYSEVLLLMDNALVGQGGNEFIAKITGNGNRGDPITTGWQQVELDLGMLSAGEHTLVIGAYNNKKTYPNESTELLVNSVLLTLQ